MADERDAPLPDTYAYLGEAIGDDGVVDFGGIKLLHRPAPGDDAWITFHRKGQAGEFINVTSWQRSELDQLLPYAREELVRDAFHSINSFYRAGRPFPRGRDGGGEQPRRWQQGLVPVYRREDGARYLSAAFVDLDAHTRGLTSGAAFGRIFDMQRAKVLPDVSLFVFSGRGLWCFWLLREEKGELPEDKRTLPPAPRAWPETVTAYRFLEQAIVNHPELRRLGADAASKDVARVMRLAGSVNSAAGGEPVRVLPQFVGGRIPTYTLPELGERFGALVPTTITRAFLPAGQVQVRAREPRRMPAKANGPRARWQYVLADLVSLISMRGGRLHEGTRHMGCCAYATTLRRLGTPLRDIHRQVTELADASGLPRAEADDAVRAAVKYRTSSPAYGEIAAWLKITPAEASQLLKLPAAGEQPRAPSVLGTRTTRERRTALLRYIEELGHVPPIVAACAYLAAAGFPVSTATVGSDYRKLKIRTPSRQGRPGTGEQALDF